MGRFEKLLMEANKLKNELPDESLNALMNKIPNKGINQFSSDRFSMNPLPQLSEGIKDMWNAVQGPREEAIKAVAEKMDFGYQAGLPKDEQFQSIASTAMDLALPDAFSVGGTVSKPIAQIAKRAKTAEELAKIASSTASKVATEAPSRFGRLIHQPTYLERQAAKKALKKQEQAAALGLTDISDLEAIQKISQEPEFIKSMASDPSQLPAIKALNEASEVNSGKIMDKAKKDFLPELKKQQPELSPDVYNVLKQEKYDLAKEDLLKEKMVAEKLKKLLVGN